jgi:calnexin
MTHLYTAIVGSDNSVKLLVDNKQVKTASLLSKNDFKPAINPEKIIDDPADSKPEDWVDEAKMDDPAAKKPEDWDEDAPPRIVDPAAEKPALWLDDAPHKVPDPKATPPGDWDVDEDGEWEAPMVDNPDCSGAGKGCGEWQAKQIANPDYKGKWHAAKVDNPAYLGVWKPRQVDNPHYFEDETPYAMAPIGGIGIELWTMQNGILFDNIVLTGSPEVAASIAASAFEPRAAAERASKQEAAQKDGGVMAKAKLYVGKAFNWCLENAMLVGATLCLGVLPLLLFCCIGGTKKAPAAAAAGPSSSSSAGGEPGPSSASAADAAEDTPEKAAGKKAGGGKKRTPKTE